MKIERLIVTENTEISELLDFLRIDLEGFYYQHIAESVDRVEFWRRFEEGKIILTKK